MAFRAKSGPGRVSMNQAAGAVIIKLFGWSATAGQL